MVKLKDLQKFAHPGGMLANLQTLKQSRLSVSKVSKKQWDFILSLAGDEEDPEAVGQAEEEPLNGEDPSARDEVPESSEAKGNPNDGHEANAEASTGGAGLADVLPNGPSKIRIQPWLESINV